MSLSQPHCATSTRSAPSSRLDAWLPRRLTALMGGAPLACALGRSSFTPERPVATLRFRDSRTLLGLLLSPELHFGDAHAAGALEATYRALEGRRPSPFARVRRVVRHSPRRSRDNVHHHYDLGSEYHTL